MFLINRIFKALCKIGIHKWVEYHDKLREGDFYCKYCNKYMDEDEKQKYL